MSKIEKWFITGASGGLGLALTRYVLEAGHIVVAAVRNPAALAVLSQQFASRLIVEKLDVTDFAGLPEIVQKHKDSDFIVNNAGGAIIGAMEEFTEAEIEHQFALNLLAPVHITRAFLPALRSKKQGRIIYITSMGGRVAFPGGAFYHAAKYGLEGFAETLAQEVAEFGIKIQIIEPGSIKTNFQANARWTTETGAYKHGTVGQLRRWVIEHGDENNSGDPLKMAAAIYTLSRQAEPELRTVLGADAFRIIEDSYKKSLKSLELQQEISFSVAIEGKTGFIPG